MAKGDFDGDRNDDLALVTTEKNGEVILLAALARGRSWAMEVVDFTHYAGREFFIIKAAPPGRYSPDPVDPRVDQFTHVRSEVNVSAWGIVVGGGVGDPRPNTRDLWFRAQEHRWRCIYSAIR